MNIIAIVTRGRSGSIFLQSLLDNHPLLITIPGVYITDFYKWYKESPNNNRKLIVENFINSHTQMFDSKHSDTIDIGFDKNSSDLAYYFGAPGEGIKYEDDGLDQSYFNDPFSGVYKDINDFKQVNYEEDGIKGAKVIDGIKSGGFLYFINKEYDIELVFFSNFILLNIRTSNKNLVKSANALSKFCELPNTKLNPKVINLE